MFCLQVTHCVRVTHEVDPVISLYLHGLRITEEPTQQCIVNAAEYLLSLDPCQGIKTRSLQTMRGKSFYRTVNYGKNGQESHLRSNNCLGFAKENKCRSCAKTEGMLLRRKKRKAKGPLRKKAPWKYASKRRLVVSLQTVRTEKEELEARLNKPAKNVLLEDKLHNSLMTIVTSTKNDDVPPLVKHFWKQQADNMIRKASGKHWSPAMIRIALMIHSQSRQVYRTLRDTGLLQLPGETTLRDYSNVNSPSQGFQQEV